jgi:hypothetical protein
MILKFDRSNKGVSVESPLEVQQLETIRNALHPRTEYEVFPLINIPIVTEDVPIHDGVNPCGDPTCYCASYGYGVPSLD